LVTVFVLLGAAHSRTLEHEIEAGRHPRVEYLELVRRHGARLSDFNEARAWRPASWVSRSRSLGPYWASALHSVRHHGPGDRLIITGEDIGLRTILLHAIVRRRRSRPHFALIMHGSYLGSRKFVVAAWMLRRMPDVMLLCLSTAIAHELSSRGVRHEQISVIGYGVDTQFFHPGAAGTGEQRNLIVAAGTANRDYATLASAVRHLPVEVRIAADSAWFREALNIDTAAVADNIEIRSCGDYVSLRRLYSESRLVVVPLRQAKRASGYAVILEAMAMGRPVITTATTGRSDFVRDGETGVLVAPGDCPSLEQAIAKLLGDEDHAGSLSSAAMELVVLEYTLEKYVERIARAAGIDST
jgi:glycosyltransferase involved in cell wall biosynthesis